MNRPKVWIILLCVYLTACIGKSGEETLRLSNGMQLYQENCANCHQADGSGLAELIPPLKNADYLQQHKNQLACLIRNGIKGQLQVNGKTYTLPMPANTKLSNLQISNILSYVQNTFGGQPIMYTEEDVQQELLHCAP